VVLLRVCQKGYPVKPFKVKVTGRELSFSKDVLARSPEIRGLLGAVDPAQPQRGPGPALVERTRISPSRTRRLACIVTLIRFGGHSLDSDNLATSFKPLQDAVASTLEIDDADHVVEWQYRQAPAGKGETGTIVKIELL